MIEKPDLSKPLLLSRHALSRSDVRQFTEEDVRFVLGAAKRLGPAKEGAKFAEASSTFRKDSESSIRRHGADDTHNHRVSEEANRMNISVEIDEMSKKPLAIYVRMAEGIAADTLEIEENSCYADIDAAGNLLGVEFLEPSALHRMCEEFAKKFDSQDFRNALDAVTRTLSFAA